MAGLINWRLVTPPGSNPDVSHVYVGVDATDGKLYLKSSGGIVTKYPTNADVVSSINTAIASLVNGAPGTLDTLAEISAALANDPNFATTIVNQITAVQASSDAHAARTDNPHSTTKAQVGLANVDNTSDVNKPVSTAQGAALGLKADKTTAISAGAGLTGGGTLATGFSIAMANVGSPATYGGATSVNVFTTDAQGRVTSVVPTAIAIAASQVTNFASSVLAVALTGFTVGANLAVAATDTVLGAISKLQGQITALQQPATTEAGSGVAVTTASSTDVLLTTMQLTPPAGTYMAEFSGSFESNTNNAVVSVSLYAGGVQKATSIRACVPQLQAGLGATLNQICPLSTNGEVTVNGSQTIEVRWSTSAGTATARARTLNITKLR